MAEPDPAAAAAAAAPDSIYKIIHDVGPSGGTLIVALIVLAATFFKWGPKILEWDIERRKNNLDWAKFEDSKKQRDDALRQHGVLTVGALPTSIGTAPNLGAVGDEDHG